MKGDHPDDRERAQPVDVRSEVEVAPASRGGEVGRVEGLSNAGSRWALSERPTGKAPCAPIGKRRLAAPSAAADNASHGEPAVTTRPRAALFRARDDAARSAARLRRLGFAVARLPVIEIVAACLYARQGSAMTRWSPPATRRFSPMCPSIAPRRSMSWARGRRARRKRAAGGSPPPPRPTPSGWPRSLKGAMTSRRRERALPCRARSQAGARGGARRTSSARGGRGLCGRSRGKAGARPRSARSNRARSRCIIRAGRPRLRRGSPERRARPRISARMTARLPVGRCRRAAERDRRGRALLVAERPDEPALFATLRQAAAVFPSHRPLPYIGRAKTEGRTSNGR